MLIDIRIYRHEDIFRPDQHTTSEAACLRLLLIYSGKALIDI